MWYWHTVFNNEHSSIIVSAKDCSPDGYWRNKKENAPGFFFFFYTMYPPKKENKNNHPVKYEALTWWKWTFQKRTKNKNCLDTEPRIVHHEIHFFPILLRSLAIVLCSLTITAFPCNNFTLPLSKFLYHPIIFVFLTIINKTFPHNSFAFSRNRFAVSYSFLCSLILHYLAVIFAFSHYNFAFPCRKVCIT